MLSSENAITYRSSRDNPTARRISGILTHTVQWIDKHYTDDIVYSRKRCRTRIVAARTIGEDIFRRDVEIAIHGAYGSCDSKRYHTKGSGPVSFKVEDNTFWDVISLGSAIDTTDDDALFATTVLTREFYNEDELGLEVESSTRFNRNFADTEELASHLEVLRNLAIGEMSMRDAAVSLIGQPAAVPPSGYLDFLTGGFEYK
jgi:hypothetical protein